MQGLLRCCGRLLSLGGELDRLEFVIPWQGRVIMV